MPLSRFVQRFRRRFERIAALAAVAVALLLTLLSRSALADDEACIAAHKAGQEERLEGRLLKARVQLVACAAPSCPAIIVEDCERWVNELNAEIPRVVIAVQDADGRERTDALLELDGAAVTTRGAAMELDPGSHQLVVKIGEQVIEQQIVARQGERNRVVRVRLPGAEPGAAPAVGAGTYAGIALGALGVVGLVTFAILGSMAKAELDELQQTCPQCARSDIDAAQTKALVADVALGVGATGLVVGGVLIAVDLTSGGAAQSGSLQGGSLQGGSLQGRSLQGGSLRLGWQF